MEPLKNMFNAALVGDVARAIHTVYPAFQREKFIEKVMDSAWDARELKNRMRHISLTLRDFLPADYAAAVEILRQASRRLQGYHFEMLIFPDFVEVYGLENWEASLPALEEFTRQSSSEGAVRPFILADSPRMMAQMLAWSQHENEHVRRLASEGCRPRLPWNMGLPHLKANPAPILPILENLKADESEYVRRSVANNLNDIAKDHPEVVIQTLQQWQSIPTPEMKKLIHHALRTLVKAGHPAALELIGYGHGAQIRVSALQLATDTVNFGETLVFSCELESLAEIVQELVIDYTVYFRKANGSLAPKVFKWTKKTLNAGEKITLSRSHPIRPITTRVYYAGEQAVELKINGEAYARQPFTLVIS